LYRYLDYPSIYHKDRTRGYQQAARPGESGARDRGMRDFAAMQVSPYFDLWAFGGHRRDPQRAVRENDDPRPVSDNSSDSAIHSLARDG